MFVHAHFTIGAGYIDPPTFWREYFSRESELKQRLVFLVLDTPWTPSFAFSAVDGAEAINEVIGRAFDAVISGHMPGRLGVKGLDDDYERWQERAEGLDTRVQVNSALTLAHPDQPFSVFGAG
jgi:hypothetical protein